MPTILGATRVRVLYVYDLKMKFNEPLTNLKKAAMKMNYDHTPTGTLQNSVNLRRITQLACDNREYAFTNALNSGNKLN